MIIEGHHVTVIDVYIYNMNIVIIGLWISNEFLLKILLEIISKAQKCSQSIHDSIPMV